MNKASSFLDSWQAEESDLPFGSAVQPADHRRPPDKMPLLLEIAQTIRRFGCTVWSIDKLEAVGTLFRFEMATRQFRVLMPMPGQIPPDELPEKGSPCHIVQTLDGLERWLVTVTNPTPR